MLNFCTTLDFDRYSVNLVFSSEDEVFHFKTERDLSCIPFAAGIINKSGIEELILFLQKTIKKNESIK